MCETLHLTKFEEKALFSLFDHMQIDEDSVWSWAEVSDISEHTGIPIKKMRGVIASLIRKGIVYIDDVDGDGTELLYVNDKYLRTSFNINPFY